VSQMCAGQAGASSCGIGSAIEPMIETMGALAVDRSVE
jgi:hypothetical protein